MAHLEEAPKPHGEPYADSQEMREERFAHAVTRSIGLQRDKREYERECKLIPQRQSILMEQQFEEAHRLITHGVDSLYRDILKFGTHGEIEVATVAVRVLGGKVPINILFEQKAS